MNAAAVVVRWRGGDEIRRCLRSLLEHGGPHLTRVVLVDSGSGDGGADLLRAAYSEVDVVALDENRSFAHAANTGAAATTEDLILLLNPDTELEAGAVDTLIGAIREHPGAAGTVPALSNPDGTSQHRWQLRRLPSIMRLATGRPGSPAFSHPPHTPTAVEQPAAAAWLVRREVWRALDGLDEEFAPAWWEDVDFCARLARQVEDPAFPADCGFSVVPDARVVHSGGSSVSELSDAEFLAAYYRNLLRYVSRHRPSRLRLIGRGLRYSLRIRGILRPGRRHAYYSASRRRFLNPPADMA